MSNTTESRSRRWSITQRADDYTVLELTEILNRRKFEWVFSLEQGGNSEYKHYQIFIKHAQPIRFSTLKKLLPNAHLEVSKGTEWENYQYVTKSETHLEGPWTSDGYDVPTEEVTEGKLDSFRRRISENGESLMSIASREVIPSGLRYLELLENQRVMDVAKQRRENVEVIWLYGPTNTGKTTWVYDHFGDENVYSCPYGNHPWDQYNGESVLFLDEFDGSQFGVQFTKKIWDKFSLILNSRFTNKVAAWTTVVVVSNWTFDQAYANLARDKEADFVALERRISRFMIKENLSAGPVDMVRFSR